MTTNKNGKNNVLLLMLYLAVLLLPATFVGWLFTYFGDIPSKLFFDFDRLPMLALAVTYSVFGFAANMVFFDWLHEKRVESLRTEERNTQKYCQQLKDDAEWQQEQAKMERESAQRIRKEAKAEYNNAREQARIDSQALLEAERQKLQDEIKNCVSEAQAAVKAKDKQYFESQKKIQQQRASNNNLYASLHKERAMRKESFELLKQVADEVVEVNLDVRALRNRIRHVGDEAYQAAQKTRS